MYCAKPPHLWGGFAQYIYLPWNAVLHHVPQGVTPELAGLVTPMANGVEWSLFDGGVGYNSTVLIQGPGQQGLSQTVICKQAGAELTDIGQVGGYTFMHRPEVARFMEIGYGLENYPQGLHFLYALLGTFRRSSTGTPGGAAAMDLLIWCHVATFLFFGLAVLWAVRRVGGEAMRKPKAFVVLGAVVAYLFFGDPVTILLRGFPNELAALALVAILVALLARPLHRMGEQLVTLAALLVGIGFTYYLYLPVTGLLCLVWLVVYRRRVRRRLWVTGAAALFALGAFVPMVVNPKANRPQQLLLQGGVIKVDQQVMLALVLAVAAGLLVRGVLRSWAWRAEALALLLTAGLTAAIYTYQVAALGSSIYYYVKACHVLLVVALVGTGALGRLLPDIPPPAVGRRRRIAALLPGTALVLAVCALFGALNGPDHSSAGGSYGMGLLRGKEGVTPTGLRVAVWATNTRPDPAGWAVVDLSHGVWANFYSTLYGSVMQRNYRTTVAWYVFMLPQGQRRSIADLEHEVVYAGVPVRFLIGDPKARFLVLDSGKSPAQTPGGEIDTGDPGAMTNIEAAEYLAAKFPGRVEIVHVGS